MTRSFSQRQIPTLLGVAILAIALVVGVVVLPQGLGVFAPRAAPETTPKNLQISNVRDNGFSVSYITDSATSGFIKYGPDETNLRLQASDDRDQTSGQVGQYITHHITVRDLQPNTTYYFTAGTGTTPIFDNSGKPFSVKTAVKGGSPSSAKTIYGNIVDSANAPVTGALVYVNMTGAGPMSTLSKDSGSWAIPLSTARTADGSQYLTINKTDSVSIAVVGPVSGTSGSANVTVDTAQPAPPIALGLGGKSAVTAVASAAPVVPVVPVASAPASLLPSPVTPEVTPTPVIASQSATPAEDTVNINSKKTETVQTDQPTITGKAAPNSTVTIEIHSETLINGQVQADANGQFVFDVAQYAQDQHLEPGQHTATISYVDTTGKTQTVTKTFYVAGDGSVQDTGSALQAATTPSPNLLALAASPTPFGTSNPYVIPSPSPSPSPTPRATATPSATVIPKTMPATGSALPRSGSTSTTAFLLIGGGLMMLFGSWLLLRKPNELRADSSSHS